MRSERERNRWRDGERWRELEPDGARWRKRKKRKREQPGDQVAEISAASSTYPQTTPRMALPVNLSTSVV